MKNVLILFILGMLTVPLVGAAGDATIEFSTDNITWVDVTHINQTDKFSYQLLLHSDTTYYFRGKDAETDWTYVSQRTATGPLAAVEGSMASLAITLFILSVAAFLYLIPLFFRLSSKPILDLILKRAAWILATYLMVLNSAIMATIAAHAGLEVTNEMVMYLWLFGLFGYSFMFLTFINTIITAIRMFNQDKFDRRMGLLDD